MTTNTSNDAYDQASAQMDSIIAMVNALQCDYETLQDLQDIKDSLCNGESLLPADSAQLDELLAEANGCIDSEDALTHILEDALSVEVRSDWAVAGEPLEASEFAILLCTGGPAVRIRGELSEHGEPARAWLEYQDWGTPWMEYHGDNAAQQCLLAYAACFLFV